MDNKTENFWRILHINQEMSRYSDTKATAVLSVCGILITLAFSNTQAIFTSELNPWVLSVMILLPGITALMSIYHAFRSIHPRIIYQKETSFLFFGSIVREFKDAEHYYQALKDELDTERSILDDLAHQIYINAGLAQKKFRDVRYSIFYFAGTIVILLFEFIGYLLVGLHG